MCAHTEQQINKSKHHCGPQYSDRSTSQLLAIQGYLSKGLGSVASSHIYITTLTMLSHLLASFSLSNHAFLCDVWIGSHHPEPATRWGESLLSNSRQRKENFQTRYSVKPFKWQQTTATPWHYPHWAASRSTGIVRVLGYVERGFKKNFVVQNDITVKY